jgi:release factor glutamine methyltransferase
VEVALALGGIKIIDVCTGSGCIAISLALAKPDAQVTATDLSPQALEIAKRNVARYGLQDRVILLEGGLLTPCHNLRDVDLIVANPPYIKPSAMSTLMRDVRDFEPHLALEGGGDDGLSCHLQIIEAARILLKPFGNVILEIGYDQKPDLENRMFDGFSLPRFVEDDAGNVRLVIYQKQE